MDFDTSPSLPDDYASSLRADLGLPDDNRYAIYRTDIEPCGFKVCLMDGFLSDEVVEEVRRVLTDAAYRNEIVEHNYAVATQFFSYGRLEAELRAMLRVHHDSNLLKTLDALLR